MTSTVFNLFLLIVIMFVFGLFLWWILKKTEEEEEEINISDYTVDNFIKIVQDNFKQRLNPEVSDYGLTDEALVNQRKIRAAFRDNLRKCSLGDLDAKKFVRAYVSSAIEENKVLPINDRTINYVIPFNSYNELTVVDKFDILLYWYKKKYGLHAMKHIINEFHLADEKYDEDGEIIFDITSEDIERVFDDVKFDPEIGTEDGSDYKRIASVPVLYLDIRDKLAIFTQRVYQRYKGHEEVDDLRDMVIDGLNVGTSGTPCGLFEMEGDDPNTITYSYDAVWIVFGGKMVHLSFLGFSSQEKLERVCKVIYKNDASAQLSSSKGYITSTMRDGSRLVTVRPPFSESWAFLLRKFGSSAKMSIKTIISDQNSEIAIDACAVLFKGCRVIAVTGEQGSGKSTLLKYLIGFIRPSFTLRIQELIFELFLRSLYPNRNIITFRETGEIPGQEGLDLQKKTDGNVNILGEVATAAVASWLVQVAKVASNMTAFTHHAKHAEDLVTAIRDNLLQTGTFTNERVAEETVADAINFDIHMEKVSATGHRYISRVTEIIPLGVEDMPDDLESSTKEYQKRMTQRRAFRVQDIIVFVKHENPAVEGFGHYEFVHPISVRSQKDMSRWLTPHEKLVYRSYFSKDWSEIDA